MTVNYDASWSFNLDQNYWENSSILGCMKNGLESFFFGNYFGNAWLID